MYDRIRFYIFKIFCIEFQRMYEALVADSTRCILHDKPFLQPLFSLLAQSSKNV